MKLSVERDPSISDALATMGEMFVDGVKNCFTLEPGRNDPSRPKGPVAAGTIAEVHMLWSDHFQRNMPHVSNRPDNRTLVDAAGVTWINVMIHPLNWPFQTEGCCGVGTGEEKDKLDASDAAFGALLPQIIAADSLGGGGGITIEYVG